MILVLRQIDLRKKVEIERRSDYRQPKSSVPQSQTKHVAPPKRAAVPSRLHKYIQKATLPDRRQNDRRKVERISGGDRRRSASRVPVPMQAPHRASPTAPVRQFAPRGAITRPNSRRVA
jgi:hypothetical protein